MSEYHKFVVDYTGDVPMEFIGVFDKYLEKDPTKDNLASATEWARKKVSEIGIKAYVSSCYCDMQVKIFRVLHGEYWSVHLHTKLFPKQTSDQ